MIIDQRIGRTIIDNVIAKHLRLAGRKTWKEDYLQQQQNNTTVYQLSLIMLLSQLLYSLLILIIYVRMNDICSNIYIKNGISNMPIETWKQMYICVATDHFSRRLSHVHLWAIDNIRGIRLAW